MTAKAKWFLVGLLLFVSIMLVGVAQAQSPDPIELQPYYILGNDEYNHGAVYALDDGWLAVTSKGVIFTCGCEECSYDEVVEKVTISTPATDPTSVPPTSIPAIIPTPTVEKVTCGCGECTQMSDPTLPSPPIDCPPAPVPEPTKTTCNRGTGNGPEDCDPGNSGGKPGSAGEDNE